MRDLGKLLAFWWVGVIGVGTVVSAIIAGFSIHDATWRTLALLAIFGLPSLVAAFFAGRASAAKDLAAQPSQADYDCRALGISGIGLRKDVAQRVPIDPLVASAKRSITMVGYSLAVVIQTLQTLIDQANSKRQVLIVLPDVTNRALMNQIAGLAKEGPASYFHDMARVLTYCKTGWMGVGDKNCFQVWLTDTMPMFSAVIVDDDRGFVQYAAHGWAYTERLVLDLRGGELTIQYKSSISQLAETQHGSVRLNTEADFDQRLVVAEAL